MMTSCFPAKYVPSYSGSELAPCSREPPCRREGGPSKKFATYINPNHDRLVLCRRPWHPNIDIQAVLTLACRWWWSIIQENGEIAALFRVVELLNARRTKFGGVEWPWPRRRWTWRRKTRGRSGKR